MWLSYSYYAKKGKEIFKNSKILYENNSILFFLPFFFFDCYKLKKGKLWFIVLFVIIEEKLKFIEHERKRNNTNIKMKILIITK